MSKWFACVVIGGAACAAFGQDQGIINPDRPGIADGSMVVGKHFQIEAGFQYERHDGGHTNLYFVPTLLRFGINSAWEVRVEGNDFTSQDSFGVLSRGYQPFSIGAKCHFLDAVGTKRPSVGFIGRVFPINGSGVFHSTQTAADGRFALDWNLNDTWSINANFGAGDYQDGNGQMNPAFLWAMTLGYSPTQVLNLFVDMGLQAPEQLQGQSSLILDVGVAYIIGKNLQLDFSVGTGVSGQTAPRPFVGAGVSVRF